MIFYKDLKIYNDSTSGSSVYGTYFSSSNTTTIISGSDNFNSAFYPSLKWGTGTTPSVSTDLGRVLTDKIQTTINGEGTFAKTIKHSANLALTSHPLYLQNIKFMDSIPRTDWLNSASSGTSNNSYFEFGTTGNTFYLEEKGNKEDNTQRVMTINRDHLYVHVDSEIAFGTSDNTKSYNKPLVRCYGKLEVKDTAEFSSTLKSGNYTCTGKIEIKGTGESTFAGTVKSPCFHSSGTLVADSYCEASYFNATSDKRAKENIHLSTYSALDLIKKVQVYNYQYKNTNDRVTGIMAQDLLEAQPKELDLVSNIQATGENGDYMSIKTDKLVSVLGKAIQEQQEQIEELKKELKTLRGGN